MVERLGANGMPMVEKEESSEMISDFKRGVAIKVRDSLKSRKEELVV